MKKQSPIWNINKDVLQKIVSEHYSYSSVLRHFGLAASGATTLRKRLVADNIEHKNLSTYRPQSHGLTPIPLKNILIENSNHNRCNIKRRLIKNGLLEYKCNRCGIFEWVGKKLGLELDHINGISNDNRLENLQLLCPNCHSQTETFAGKNRKKKWCPACGKWVQKDERCSYCGFSFKQISNKCVECNSKVTKKSIRCINCNLKLQRKVERPSKENLNKLIKEVDNWSELGRRFGVSDNTVRKWANQYKLL